MDSIPSLVYLPPAYELLRSIGYVSRKYEEFGLPQLKRTQNSISLPVVGGEITYIKSRNKEKIHVSQFPYEDVYLNRYENDAQWSITKGNIASQEFASKLLNILFMNNDTLESYLHQIKAIHNIT